MVKHKKEKKSKGHKKSKKKAKVFNKYEHKLLDAILLGFWPSVEKIAKKGKVSLNFEDSSGETPLQYKLLVSTLLFSKCF
jgi:hypothetical protein